MGIPGSLTFADDGDRPEPDAEPEREWRSGFGMISASLGAIPAGLAWAFSLRSAGMLAVGIDIGSTKIRLAVVEVIADEPKRKEDPTDIQTQGCDLKSALASAADCATSLKARYPEIAGSAYSAFDGFALG